MVVEWRCPVLAAQSEVVYRNHYTLYGRPKRLVQSRMKKEESYKRTNANRQPPKANKYAGHSNLNGSAAETRSPIEEELCPIGQGTTMNVFCTL